MQAIILEQYGAADNFKQINIPIPVPSDNEVLIEVKATSVNPADYKIRDGSLAVLGPDLPAILHSDVAGTVIAVGKKVTQFNKGDEVYGCAGGFKGLSGALTEYMVTDPHLLALKPRSLTMAQAAALPLVAITAWEALVSKAHIKPNQTVLVFGGTGGVGHLAVQLAIALKAKVFATCRDDRKAKIIKEFGAQAINLSKESIDHCVAEYTHGEGFDIVLDTVGGNIIDNSIAAAKKYGQVITILGTSTHDLSLLFFKNLSLHTVLMPEPLLSGQGRAQYGEILKEIAKLVDAGQIKPLIDEQQFTFSQVAKAHMRAESGEAIGKVVLVQG